MPWSVPWNDGEAALTSPWSHLIFLDEAYILQTDEWVRIKGPAIDASRGFQLSRREESTTFQREPSREPGLQDRRNTEKAIHTFQKMPMTTPCKNLKHFAKKQEAKKKQKIEKTHS